MTDEPVRDLVAADLEIEGLANLSVRSLNDEKTQWEATGVVDEDLVEASQSGGGGGAGVAWGRSGGGEEPGGGWAGSEAGECPRRGGGVEGPCDEGRQRGGG